MWRSDLERMKAAGITTIRIAEFAWSKTEPQEGCFTFAFFDEFLDVAESEDMRVIFCTPTATPPAWLTEKYPEVLNARKDGVPYRHGMRRHYNYNSAVYRKLCARIVEKLASHYAARACIIGWQIDNELNCETDEFYSESDSVAFRAFLKERYKTLDALNEAWGTAFWNQTYTDWNEVYVPRVTVTGGANPHLALDYSRFVSESTISFCAMQADIIRRYKKGNDFITTNGMFANVDNCRMTDSALDIYMYDSYPNFAFAVDAPPKREDSLLDRAWSRNLTEVRAICPHFGIMEQQTGSHGWNTHMEAPAPKPGQLMLWAFQSIAHGADYVSFFRWRSARFGTEMYWQGILDYDSRDTRKLKEIASLAERLRRLQSGAVKAPLTGSRYVADVAMIRDYDNLWDARVDVWHGKLHWESENAVFAACELSHTPLDFCFINDETALSELMRYKVLFYPHPYILTEKRAALLTAYVEAGGILIVGARTGMKDSRGHCVALPMSGLLGTLTQTTVEEFTFVGPADGTVLLRLGDAELDSGIFNDVLSVAENAESADEARAPHVIATYAGNYYAGAPAAVQAYHGKGSVIHYGGTFTRESTKALLLHVGALSPYERLLHIPPECELCVREKDDMQSFIVLNYSSRPQTLQLQTAFTNAENGARYGSPADGGENELTLSPYGVVVLVRGAV